MRAVTNAPTLKYIEKSIPSLIVPRAASRRRVAARMLARALVLVLAIALAGRTAHGATTTVVKPTLRAHVARRARVFSPGLDPAVERGAAAWFAHLWFYALREAEAVGSVTLGGAATGSDGSFAKSYCVDARANASTVDAYDYVGWLPMANAIEDMIAAHADAKVILFETICTEWWTHASAARAEAAKLGERCGCSSGSRSSASECGDSSYHYCDVYPCLWNRAFGSAAPVEETWKRAYIERVRAIKAAVPSDRILTVPMTTNSFSHATAVKISKEIAEFLGISDDTDAFSEAYPFVVLRDVSQTELGKGAVAWSIIVLLLSVWILFLAHRKDPVRKFLRRRLKLRMC